MRSLPSWQVPFLGLKRFPRALTRFEIDTFFTFADAELAAIHSRRVDALRLATGVHLGFLRMTGTTLDALDRIPAFVLARVATELDLPSVDIATVRSLYRRRRRTLFEHQRWAMATLGIEPFTDHRARALVRAFSPPVVLTAGAPAVAIELMRWLHTRGILIPGARRVRSLATHVRRRAKEALATTVVLEIGEPARQDWAARLFATRPETTATYLQWLATPPAQRSPIALTAAIEKRRFLLELGVPTHPLSDVPLATLVDLAGRCRARRPSAVARLPEPGRTIELACFLRHAWLKINDTVLALADALTTDLRREAHEAALRSAADDVASLRSMIGRVRAAAEDEDRTDQNVRAFILAEIPAQIMIDGTRAYRQREALIGDIGRVRQRLAAMTTPRLVATPRSAVGVLLEHRARQRTGYGRVRYDQPLPPDVIAAMSRRWRAHLAGRDTSGSHAVFDAALLVTLQRALRNGSVWAPESLRHVERDAMMIERGAWRSQRAARYRELGLPLGCDGYLRQRLDLLESALGGVALAAERRAVRIDERGIVLEPFAAERTDRLFERARNRLVSTADAVQLSAIIVEIDRTVRFSWQLLQRAPRNPRELLALYGALSLLEHHGVLRAANDTVVALMYRQPITRHWGTGTAASSDGMSLDVSRRLWNARTDPKRRRYGMGQYQHVLDRWGIVYHQPLVLGTRQAEAAIEGAVRQRVAPAIDRVAVDTHGYTDFAMGLARLLGFDLCPRLKGLRDRRLHVLVGFAVPEAIASITRADVVPSAIESEWDTLVRLAASIRAGTTSATAVLKRLCSVSRGDPLYRAGTMLGRLERSLLLCDLVTNPDFRRTLHPDLSHDGEAVHSLQRAIHRGTLGPRRGRRGEEMAAISGSLTLLTNLVMTWNTLWLQRCHEEALAGRGPASVEHVVQMAPIHHRHINFNGELRFELAEAGTRPFAELGTSHG